MKKVIYSTAALALALGLAGCGDGNGDGQGAAEAPASPSASQSQEAEKVPGKGNISSDGVDFTTLSPEDLKLTTEKDFTFISSNNATGHIEFVKNDDPRVKEIEAFLDEAVGYHREYMVAEVDNRKGSEVANMYAVNVYDPDGMKYEFSKAYDLIEEAAPVWNSDDTYYSADGSKELTEKEYQALNDRSRELAEAQTWAIDPMEKGTFILAMEIDEGALPKEIEGVTVMAHGIFDDVRAYNPLLSEYREWKAFQEEGKEWEAHDPEAEPTSEGE